MKRSWKWTVFAGGLVALCGAFITGRSWADGIPATGALAYSGRLEAPTGDPLTGTFNLELNFWNTPDGAGSPLCTTNSQSVALEQGRFSLNLPDECTDAVQANADVWIEILVDGTSLGRTKTGAVPYAVEASHATTADIAGSADTLGALAPGDVQERVTGSCGNANQSIKTISANGTVTCETDDNTTYTGSNGVSVTGTTISTDTSYVQRRNSLLSTGCNGTNQSIKTISDTGAVTCETDNDTTYTEGSGIDVNVTTISILGNGVTRSHLSGSEVQVYEEAAGCGGGLTTSTTCTTLACDHHGSIDFVEFRNCAGTCVNNSVAPSICPGLEPIGWLLAP